MEIVVVNGKGEGLIRNFRHPWIYRGAVKDIVGNVSNGSVVRVVSEDKTTLGWGFYSQNSLIALRLFDFSGDELAKDWLERKIESAYQLRRCFTLNSNAYRLINSEGDMFPGLVADVYNGSVVIKPQVRAVEVLLGRIIDVIRKIFPDKKVYLKRDERAARVEGLERLSGYLVGEGDGRDIIEENGIKFIVDYARGQKTGFYLDQRENRAIMLEISRKKRVLNLFSYTGGFSLYAIKGRATQVTSVESSGYAVELSRRNLELNEGGFIGETGCEIPIEWIKGNAMNFISGMESGQYDIIVLDPPPFARRQGELKGAIRGYSELNYNAIEKVSSGGFILTFSCSGVVTREIFRDIIFKQAIRARRDVRIVRDLYPPPDHPVYLFHPEGEYLKGFLLYVE